MNMAKLYDNKCNQLMSFRPIKPSFVKEQGLSRLVEEYHH